MATTSDPLERQPGESPEANLALQAYAEQDRTQRSLRRLSRALDKPWTTISDWSSKYGWVQRVAAYDRHLDGLRRRERQETILATERRQVVQLAAAREALTAPVQELLRRISEARSAGEDPFAGVPTSKLITLATSAARNMPSLVEAERLVLGLTTENVGEGAPTSAEEARTRAAAMSREEIDDYLLGVDDGRVCALRQLGLDDPV